MVKVENTNIENLEGVLEAILYTSEETHFTVGKFRFKENEPCITVVGNIFSTNEGERLRISGKWKKHSKYGTQLEIERFEVILPTKKDAIEKYLGSGIIHGVGESLAKRIVKKFGDETFDILDNEPQRLREVSGIGKKKVVEIENSWKVQRNRHEMMLFLTSHGIKGSRAVKIYKKYGGNLVSIIKNNPYRLAIDIEGIGFLTADKIAREVGIPEDHPERIEAALIHVMYEAGSSGHCYLPKEELITETKKLLKLDEEKIGNTLQQKLEDGRFKSEEQKELIAIYLKRIYFYETQVAEYLQHLLTTPFSIEVSHPVKAIEKAEKAMNIKFHSEQTKALEQAFAKKISVITGGPGVGKTTIIKALVTILEKNKARIALAAPTGRAAKRLSEAANSTAGTIHRLLRYNPHDNSFEFNKDKKLEIDYLIIDETSMMDITLSFHLLSAVPKGAAIVFVGDCDQLPSVGSGNFLGDLIKSGVIPFTRLTYIYRQSSGSSIVQTAHEINSGYLPKIVNNDVSDIFFLPEEDPQKGCELISDLVSKRLIKKYDLDPFHDIQVLVPMYRGEIGADNLNSTLSKVLNPGGKEIGTGKFREGDKVMQISNNYEKEVYNGDTGIITSINRIEQNCVIKIDGREVTYQYSELDQITLAYAISIHKSQGSEYPAVIVPLFTQHYIMLQRNLLYTAITRGKKLVIIVGNWQALRIAVNNVQAKNRYTKLAERIRPKDNRYEQIVVSPDIF